MILKDFAYQINELSKRHRPTDEVLINLHQMSMGARPSVPLDRVYAGMDWEKGSIRLVTDSPIILDSHDRDIPLEPKMSMGVLWCLNCQYKVDEIDTYCRHCGKKLKA